LSFFGGFAVQAANATTTGSSVTLKFCGNVYVVSVAICCGVLTCEAGRLPSCKSSNSLDQDTFASSAFDKCPASVAVNWLCYCAVIGGYIKKFVRFELTVQQAVKILIKVKLLWTTWRNVRIQTPQMAETPGW
jgi:hypothetical protein